MSEKSVESVESEKSEDPRRFDIFRLLGMSVKTHITAKQLNVVNDAVWTVRRTLEQKYGTIEGTNSAEIHDMSALVLSGMLPELSKTCLVFQNYRRAVKYTLMAYLYRTADMTDTAHMYENDVLEVFAQFNR